MNPHRFAFTQIVCVSERDEDAEAEYSEAVDYFYRFANKVAPRYTTAPGYQSPRSMRHVAAIHAKGGQAGPRGAEQAAAIKGELTWKDYVEKGFVIAGSPATVRERLREVATELRIGQLIATLQMGNLGEEQTKKNTYLFAKEVMPGLRDLWSEWPDNWTPARPAAVAAGV
jgi:alkanesulfonate monooxygenase SsuD/methylene tetrahydromethanopterin reductase-like flavin-dependent oxidoreductase (luciferase family)